MALFFNFKAQCPKAETLNVMWHPVLPVLAIATVSGSVHVCSEEGDRVDANIVRQHSASTCLAWHPTQKLLCVGWRDGTISWWSAPDTLQKEADPVHERVPIVSAEWAPSGSHFVSADAAGFIVVWRLDTRSRLLTKIKASLGTSVVSSVCFLDKPRIVAQPHDHSKTAAPETVAESSPEDSSLEAADPLLRARVLSDDVVVLVGTEDGKVIILDDVGNKQTLVSAQGIDGSAVRSMLYYTERCELIVGTDQHTLARYHITKHFYLTKLSKVKFRAGSAPSKVSGDGSGLESKPRILWAGRGLICTSASEATLRLWHLDHDVNYELSLADQEDDIIARTRAQSECMSCVCFTPRKRVRGGGPRHGRVVFWQFVGPANDAEQTPSPADWEAFAEIDLELPIADIAWGPGETLLAARMKDAVSILHETVLRRKMSGTIAIVQMSPEMVTIEHLLTHRATTVKSALRIKGLDVYGNLFAVYNEKHLELYEIADDLTVQLIRPTFQADALCVALHSEGVFLAKRDRVELYSLAMARRQVLSFTDAEGGPLLIEVAGEHIVVGTTRGYVKVWHIVAGGQCRPVKTFHLLANLPQTDAKGEVVKREITSVRINHTGTKVSALMKAVIGGVSQPDTLIHVVDLITEKHFMHDFGTTSRFALSHAWDETEPRLLGVETRKFGAGDALPATEDGEDAPSSRVEVTTLFASPTKGLVVQDSFHLQRSLTALIGVALPDLYFYCRFRANEDGTQSDSHVEARRMRDFEGVDMRDANVWKTLLEFSYCLTCADGEEAKNSVKDLGPDAPWHNMAIMCVKTGRLDIADICVSKLQDALAARALREAREEDPSDTDALTACLAIHLGRVDDAERIYRKARRYHLLVKLFMAMGRWDAALSSAERLDRIHLLSVHYEYARYLEQCGEVESAIAQYELSDTHRYEVPRMLFDLNRVPTLEKYVESRKDPELIRWWAQWCERNDAYDEALRCYRDAGDVLSTVRLYCFLQCPQKAADLLRDREDLAGCYHLARQYEESGHMDEALEYFTRARAYRHAIRLAKDLERSLDVMNLALKCSRKPVLLDAAMYFEKKKKPDKAVLLYQRGGETMRAVDLCVTGSLSNELIEIADDLNAETTDSTVYRKLGDVFLQQEQWAYAAKMFVHGRAFDQALKVYAQQNVTLTEELADEMSLGPDATAEQRQELLLNIARVAKHQESYHLACKKFTQAGDKVKAAKALLASGDTQHVIFFAAHSRNTDVFILSANYLQTREWQTEPDIAKSIVSFYTKGKAYESLALFYEAVAVHEVVESRGYDKALAALKEARKALGKIKPSPETLIAELARKTDPVEQFVTARKAMRSDPMRGVRVCHELMEGIGNEEHVLRIGDVFALLSEFHVSKGEMREAKELIEKMRERDVNPQDFMDWQVIRKIYAALGVENPLEQTGDLKHTGEAHEVEVDDDVVDDSD
eukprot:TRINITY_DN1313_c0_g1_i1.p1 TRINITY_DN1313_c0_g1~~TRINITY_DN1313_c0_g1_i1.p1  ORF type:complete len:1450 (+),score=425.61 TRINITY_DN1313_c0_g1_i1:245-4594(+)